MSDLADTVDRLFSDHCTPKLRLAAETGVWPADLWRACMDAGLHLALVDTGPDALGLATADAFAIARLAGAHAVPAPLVETMAANWALARAGQAPRAEPLVLIAAGDHRRIPWGRRATRVSIVGAFEDVQIAPAGGPMCHGYNIAREPRDDLGDRRAGREPAAGELSSPAVASMAALRTAQMAGAIEAITRLTVDYAQTRVQFGRPLGKNQAVQHAVAILAELAAASVTAATMASDAFERGLDLPGIAAAKCYTSEAAGQAAAIAHQMHGAIGFTQDFALHHLTRRLWSWRDEAGSEAAWAIQLGRHLSQQGPEQLWPEITKL